MTMKRMLAAFLPFVMMVVQLPSVHDAGGITITLQGNSSLGSWSGTHKTGEVSNKSITWTVKKKCSFEWYMVVN